MAEITIRLGILLLAGLLAWGAVWFGRLFVEQQRRQALAAAPAALSSIEKGAAEAGVSPSSVRILAFSSEDCHQCHQLQAPALQRVKARFQDGVTIEEVDAPSSPELTQRYHVLTVPTTVILDPSGRPHAVNYGFANTQRLIDQVQEAITSLEAEPVGR